MEWTRNNDPNILPEHGRYLIYIRAGDEAIACPEQDGWYEYEGGVRYEHTEVTHYCLIERPY